MRTGAWTECDPTGQWFSVVKIGPWDNQRDADGCAERMLDVIVESIEEAGGKGITPEVVPFRPR